MAKTKTRQLSSVSKNNVPQGQARRLEGDDLMIWSILQERARTLNQQMGEFIEGKRQEGVIGANETPDGAGYILPIPQQGPRVMQVPQVAPSEPQEAQ